MYFSQINHGIEEFWHASLLSEAFIFKCIQDQGCQPFLFLFAKDKDRQPFIFLYQVRINHA